MVVVEVEENEGEASRVVVSCAIVRGWMLLLTEFMVLVWDIGGCCLGHGGSCCCLVFID